MHRVIRVFAVECIEILFCKCGNIVRDEPLAVRPVAQSACDGSTAQRPLPRCHNLRWSTPSEGRTPGSDPRTPQPPRHPPQQVQTWSAPSFQITSGACASGAWDLSPECALGAVGELHDGLAVGRQSYAKCSTGAQLWF